MDNAVLARHTSTTDIFLKNTSIINPKNIGLQSGHLKDLSTNLIGIFKKKDLYIKVINDELFNSIWEIGAEVRRPVYKKDFILDDQRGCFCLRISDLLGLNATLPPINNYQVEFKVLHTPVPCNFWHFSIRVFSSGEELTNIEMSDSARKMIWKGIKDFLVGVIYYDQQMCISPIPSHCYTVSD